MMFWVRCSACKGFRNTTESEQAYSNGCVPLTAENGEGKGRCQVFPVFVAPRNGEELAAGVTRRSLREYSARDLADHLLGSTEAPERAVLVQVDVFSDGRVVFSEANAHAYASSAANANFLG